MSVQFGRWNLDGRPVDARYLEKVTTALAPYGPDGGRTYGDKNISIQYYAFHTTQESRLEAQPHISASGAVITWDGRLDNRTELFSELHNSLTVGFTDVAIVAAAYEKWGLSCFEKLIGDWALSIWRPDNQSLTLAKDPIGTHSLYYSFDRNRVTWSTILDPLVRFGEKTLALNKEYIAGYLSMHPALHLTPFLDVHSVRPSTSVVLLPGKHTISEYWDLDPGKRIRYTTDAEYEEHFRTVFTRAVQRRLRSDSAVLAELSGGRDSSSIVCMADTIIARGEAQCPRLETISYYDDTEPNWNERPYFTKVEEKRGRVGWHIDVGLQDPPKIHESQSVDHVFVQNPGNNGRSFPQFSACLASQGNRVVLSGVGGDEIMGGVPTPTPELQDLLVGAQFGELAHRLKAWALKLKTTWFHLLWQVARDFLPPAIVGVRRDMRPAPWLQFSFVKDYRAALTGYASRRKLFGPLPSFQQNISTLDALRRQLACTALPFAPPYEKRYPFLDRDLLEFMFAIPPEQVVRPTQRRSLMRRALVGIVPDEVLNRKMKAFVNRAPLRAVTKDWSELVESMQNMASGSLGIIDSVRLSEALQNARRGEQVPIIKLMRTIYVEGWLRTIGVSGIVDLEINPGSELACRDSTQR